MATQIPIPSGPTNRELIERAYQMCGLHDGMFGRTEEEINTGLGILSGMMYESPFDNLGFDFDDAAGLRAAEESGIPRKWKEAVSYKLAERLAPVVGKTISGHVHKAGTASYAAMVAAVLALPTAKYAEGTARGRGHRRYRRRDDYFSQEVEASTSGITTPTVITSS